MKGFRCLVAPTLFILGLIVSPYWTQDALGGTPTKTAIKYNESKWGKVPDKVITDKAAQYVLITATVHPAPHPEDVGMRYFHRRLGELTNGKMSTNYYAGGVLTKDARDLLDLNMKGDVDVTRHDSSAVGAISPTYEATRSVFLFDNPGHVHRFTARKEFLDRAQADLAKNNLVLFNTFAFSRHLYARKPVKSLDDLKGMKVRTMEVPIVIEAFKTLGANPTPLPFGELYTSLQTGMVDAGEGSATAYFSNKLNEVAKNLITVNYTYDCLSLTINKKKYDSLPPDLTKAVMQAGRETVGLIREIYAEWENDVIDVLRQAGVNVITQKDMADFPKWQQKIRDAKVNEGLFKKAGEDLARVIEETRQ